MNFDGVAKGTPSATGFSGVCRNVEGEILQVFHGSIGFNTNNAVELEGLIQGLRMMLGEGWLPTMVEGDSNVIIKMQKQLANG